jgi:cell division protein FtsB
MPTSSATYGQRTGTPRRVAQRRGLSKVQWDRKFRTVLLIVLALIAWIGIHAGLTLLNTRNQARTERQIVLTLAASNRRLESELRSLNQHATIIRDARALGMIRPGEQPYVVTNLPSR